MTLDSAASPPTLDPENPWPGLAWFDESAARFFNGRRREIAELKRLVLQAPLTVLFGRSGLGKTSLLKAGLFPALRDAGMLPVYVRIDFAAPSSPADTGERPVEQIAAAFAAACSDAGVDVPARVPGQSLWDYLHRSDFKVWSAQNQPLTPVFVIDQFEEVFTLGSARPDTVGRLREDLADLIENRIPVQTEGRLTADEGAGTDLALRSQRYRVLLSFREDFATAFERWRELPSLMRNRLQLGSMSGEQAFEATYNSAAHLMDRATAEQVVRFVASARRAATAPSAPPQDADQPLVDLVVEPALLSLVCRGLNERRKARKAHGTSGAKDVIDPDLLAATGSKVIDEFYDACMGDQPERTHRFVESELITESGFRKPCAQDDAMREPYGIALEALRVLVDRRLLRIEPSLGVTRVELIHDLLTPTVVARRDARRHADESRRVEEEVRRQQRQRDEAAAAGEERVRARRKLRFAALSVTVAALIATLLGLSTWYATTEARRATKEENRATAEAGRARAQAVVAKSRELAAAAVARLDLDPELAVALALEAATVSPTIQAESALRQALLKWSQKPAAGGESRRKNGTTTGVAGSDASAGLKWLAGHPSDVLSVAFSPDGKRLLSTGCDGTARLWDVDTGAPLKVLREHRSGVMVGTFSTDGTLIATAGGDYCLGLLPRSEMGLGDTRVIIWNATSGELVKALKESPMILMGAAFSPDGQTVAAAGWESVLYTWNVQSGSMRKLGTQGTDGIQWVEYSPDGKQLATAGVDGSVVFWHPDNGTELKKRHHDGQVMAVSYSADGAALASVDHTGVVRIWDPRTFALRREMKSYNNEPMNTATFSRDGRFIITAGDGENAYIWEAATGSRLQPVNVGPGSLYGTAFSSDGRRIAFAGSGGRVGLFDCEVCVSLEELLKLASQRKPRGLTDRERKDFIENDDILGSPKIPEPARGR